MSTDKIAVAIIEEFIKKTRIAIRSSQKEIRISSNDAENLVYNLNLVLLKLLDKQQVEQETADRTIVNVALDGGGFE